jgi:type IV pilus assembly protein PilW
MKRQYGVCRQKGFSLVEFMVAMAIGLFLTAGVVGILVHNKRASTLISDTLDIQDAARFATRRIGNLFRMAGHRGGIIQGQVSINSNTSAVLTEDGVCKRKWMVSNASGDQLLITEPIRGYADGAGIVDTGECATLGITDANHLDNTDILVVRHSEILHESDPNSLANQDRFYVYTIVSVGASVGLGQHIASRWSAFSGQPEKVYGRYIYPYYTDIYYIRAWSNSSTENPQRPALVRLRMDGATAQTQLMVSGVEFMKAEFGIDSDGDAQVDQYRAPAAISDWSQVMLARLAIVARSIGEDPQAEDSKTYVLLAGENQVSYQPAAAFKRYARMMFEVSIHLRNTVEIRQAN